jgi:hypothetical protein
MWPSFLWEYEGVAFYAHSSQETGTLPVHRFWSDVYLGHFYTINEDEKDFIIATWPDYFAYGDVAFYAYPY